MSKQWTMIGVVVAGLALGAAALTWVAPDSARRDQPSRPRSSRRSISPPATRSSLEDYTRVGDAGEHLGHLVPPLPRRDAVHAEAVRLARRPAASGSPRSASTRAARRTSSRSPSEFGLTFDILHDRTGQVERLYQTTGVPESFLLDRRGILVKRVIGAHDWSSPANVGAVERLLEQPGDVAWPAGSSASRHPATRPPRRCSARKAAWAPSRAT